MRQGRELRVELPGDRPLNVAVFADAHGNLPATRAVADAVLREAPDLVVVNGDLVNRGPDGVAVLEYLEGRVEGPRVLGNHDDLMRLWVRRDPALPAHWFHDPFWQANDWCAERLRKAKWLAPIGRWPTAVRIGLAGGGPEVLVTHGSPRHYREGYGPHLPDETYSEILEMHPAQVLVGSHTHRPLTRTVGRWRIFNTGAVGAPFDGDPNAAWLSLRYLDGAWQGEVRRVGYDREEALAAFERSGYVSECGLPARIHWLELALARSLSTPFMMWADARSLPLTEASWQRFVRDRDGDLPQAPDEAGARAAERSGLLP